MKMAFIVPNLGNRTDIVLRRIRYTGIPVTTGDSKLIGPLHIAYASRKQMLFLTIAFATVSDNETTFDSDNDSNVGGCDSDG